MSLYLAGGCWFAHLFGLSVVAIVGLFSSFVVSIFAQGGCSRAAGGKKVRYARRVSMHLGLWKREMGQAGRRGPLVFPRGQNSSDVCDIQGFFKGRE